MNRPMNARLPLSERAACGRRLRQLKGATAENVTDEFLRNHPDWLERYGERARAFGREDAGFHIEFLAGAVVADSPAAFAEYARWAARVLHSRGIAAAFLVENLRQVERVLLQAIGEPWSGAVSDTIAAGIAAAGAPVTHGRPASPAHGLAETRRLLSTAALAGNRRAALTIVQEALTQGHPLLDVYMEVFEASQREIGRMWETNRISVANEHMATAVTQYVMARIAMDAPRAPDRGTVVVTGVDGEQHQIGGNLISDALMTDGWDVQFLGTNMPHEGIVQVVERRTPAVLGISVTMLFNIPRAVALIDAVRGMEQPPAHHCRRRRVPSCAGSRLRSRRRRLRAGRPLGGGPAAARLHQAALRPRAGYRRAHALSAPAAATAALHGTVLAL